MLVAPEVSALIASIPYASSHGAYADRVGGGIIYYALTSLIRARVCVCLGSGGGFVPCLMRQAQRDLGIERAETYLVDAILPEAGFGGPDEPGGWLDPDGVFRQHYPDITVLNCHTREAARGFFKKNRVRIDYLHIDADHSLKGALEDSESYLPLMQPSGIVTLHDTSWPSIQEVLKRIRSKRPEFQCLDLPDIGAGLAILRRKCEPAQPPNGF